MAGVHRITDLASGHSCPPGGNCGYAPPTIALTGSSNVLVNGLGAVRMGDIIKPHSCFNCGGECDSVCSPHDGVYLGSRSVLVNGRPIQVMGDITSCTSIALGCSPNVMAN